MYEKALNKVAGLEMPSDEIFREKIDELEKLWGKWSDVIITELNEVTKLEWMDTDIRCYVTAGIPASFSHPLTLKIYGSIDDTFDVFVHELIHRLLHNPNHPQRFKDARDALVKEYENESLRTRNHIILHAIHAHILVKFFDRSRLKRASQFLKTPDYMRSWEIVNTSGYENIIKRIF